MSEIILPSNAKITVAGMSGTGKTFLEQFGIIPQLDNFLIFDPSGEYEALYPDKCIIPQSDDPAELDAVAKEVYAAGDCMLIVSEAEIYLPSGSLTKYPNTFKLVTRGRRRNVGFIADTRRIANLNKTVFGLSDHVFIFRHFSPNDIIYLQEFIPADCDKLRELPDWNFWYFTHGKVEVCPPIKVR